MVFSSLSDCLDSVREQYPELVEPVEVKVFGDDPAGPSRVQDMPRFLYRGESGVYPTTLSSFDRLALDFAIPVRAVEDIIRVRLRVGFWLMEKVDVPAMVAKGYLQHYGLPTEFVDLTSSLEIVQSFASEVPVGGQGAIAVLPVKSLVGVSTLVDLTQVPLAVRARRQSAFVVRMSEYRDLKDRDLAAGLGFDWLTFTFSAEDQARFRPEPGILDAATDPVAGFIQLCLNFEGKMSDAAARWIADRVPPAPVVGRADEDKEIVASDDAPPDAHEDEAVAEADPDEPAELADLRRRLREVSVPAPETLTLISSAEAGFNFDVEREREKNYRRWSEAFPDDVGLMMDLESGTST